MTLRVAVITQLFAVILGLLIPAITVAVRRLHDIGLSGWLYLVSLVPYVGGLFLFVCSLIPSSDEENQHGPSPRIRSARPTPSPDGVVSPARRAGRAGSADR